MLENRRSACCHGREPSLSVTTTPSVVVTWDRALTSAAASMSLRLSQPRGRRAPEIPSGWAAEFPGRDELRMGRGVGAKTYTERDSIPIHLVGEAGVTEIASADPVPSLVPAKA